MLLKGIFKITKFNLTWSNVVCVYSIKLSVFFLGVIGLVLIAKKPIMPKDVSVSFDLSLTFTGQEYSFWKCFAVFIDVYCFCSRGFTGFTCSTVK